MTTTEQTCLDRFKLLFNQMSAHQLGELQSVYSADTAFTDPFVSIRGLDALNEYFGSTYANVIDCSFTFEEAIKSGDEVCLPWTMTLRHRRIRRGEAINVDGISRLKILNDRVIFHRDYFDAGQLLYENLPVLGSAVRWIRKHAA